MSDPILKYLETTVAPALQRNFGSNMVIDVRPARRDFHAQYLIYCTDTTVFSVRLDFIIYKGDLYSMDATLQAGNVYDEINQFDISSENNDHLDKILKGVLKLCQRAYNEYMPRAKSISKDNPGKAAAYLKDLYHIKRYINNYKKSL